MALTLNDLLVLLVAGVVGYYVFSNIGERFWPSALGLINRRKKRGHPWQARFVEVISKILSQVIGLLAALSAAVAFIVFVSIVFPWLDTFVKAYRPKFFELAQVLITASSVLLGFALTSDAILAGARIADKGRLAVSQRVKTTGFLCVVLSLGALILDGNGLGGLAELVLETALFLLFVEAYFASAFVRE